MLGLVVVAHWFVCSKLCDRSRIQGKISATIHHLQTFIVFTQISGDSSHLYGDGMAVWLTKDRAKEGPVFGNQGRQKNLLATAFNSHSYILTDNFEGLAIFLDT